MDPSADLARLEEARLVSVVVDASGINDKDFAEFVIDLAHNETRTRDEFVSKLLEMDDSLERAFAERLHGVIMQNTSASKRQALARAHAPTSASSSTGSGSSSFPSVKDEVISRGAVSHPAEAAKFPSLALPDGAQSRDMAKGDTASFTGLRPDDTKYERGSSSRSGAQQQDRWGGSGSGSRESYSRGSDRGGSSGNNEWSRDRADRDIPFGYAPPPAGGYSSSSSAGPAAFHPSKPRLFEVVEAEVLRVGDYSAQLTLCGFGSPAPEATLPAAGLRHTGATTGSDGSGSGSGVGGVVGGTLGEGGRLEIKSVLRPRQRVWVKILSEAGGKYSVSMRDVEQSTGRDLRPIRQPADSSSSSSRNTNSRWGNGSEPPRPNDRSNAAAASRARRLTSPERWRAQLLAASGVMGSSEGLRDTAELASERAQAGRPLAAATGAAALVGMEYLDKASGGGNAADEEDIDIELNEDEPSFLKDQTYLAQPLLRGGGAADGNEDDDAAAASGVEANDVIKIVRMPHGSLAHAAVTQAAMAKARRAAHEDQRAQAAEAVPTELGRGWADPMAAQDDRLLAVDLKGLAAGQAAAAEKTDLPEWKKDMLSKNLTYGKVTTLSMREQRESLPIFQLRSQLLQAVADNQILVVIGETGSGKTTQMTQYLAEAGYTSGRRVVGCTQPRRVAATSIAKRVADEVGCKVGAEVGYCVRFEDCTSADTVIKYMTDGMLLRELLLSPNLDRYSVIILDEAHERTINTDVLFGLLKSALSRRKDLKLIVTSATLDAEKFSGYFGGAPIFTIPGRMFPVTIHFAQETPSDYLESALLTVLEIHISQPPGDILLFLTGKEEIDTACEVLYDRCKQLGRNVPPLEVLPVYSTLPSEMQSRIFEPAARGTRKCVVATNIAEASLTIDGIFYVVDPGFCKIKAYNPKLAMDSLVIAPISQASANQRAGRAGRTGPGRCYRLYTKDAFQSEMMPTTVPEIQRTNLGNVVLMLKAMGVNDMLGFDFMDPPPPATMIMALQSLFALGALDDDGLLTRLGRKMAEFPLEPQLSKVLIASVDLECGAEVLTVVAMLSVDEVFFRPRDKQAQADAKRARFFQPEGDHVTLLTVYDSWMSAGQSAGWCQENYVTSRSMRSAQDVRKQLASIMDRYRLPMVSCGKHVHRLCRAICSGYFMNAAKKDPQEGYKTLVESQPAYLHPSSSLYSRPPEWVIYHKLVLTTKEYLHGCLAIDPRWLVDLAPNFFRKCDETQLSRRKKRERLEPLFDKFHAPNEWRLSRRKG